MQGHPFPLFMGMVTPVGASSSAIYRVQSPHLCTVPKCVSQRPIVFLYRCVPLAFFI